MVKKILYTGIVAMLLGCSKSDELSTPAADGVISFKAGEIATRVADSGSTLSWESDDQIYITDGTYDAIYQISNTSTGALSKVSGNDYYTSGTTSQTFYSWTPLTLTATDGVFSFDLTDQGAESQVVMSKVTTSSSSATFTFAPIYTKVVFNLTAGGTDVIDLTGATAILTGVNITGDYDYMTGSFSNFTATDLTPDVVIASNDKSCSTATITAYILETTSMDGDLTITVGSDRFVISLAGKSWAKGNMYEYDVTLGDGNGAIATLADFAEGGKYATTTPTVDSWMIIDASVSPSDFDSLRTILQNLGYSRNINLNFPNLESFPDNALYQATALASLSAPNITSIGDSAFYGCYKLSGDLTIPSGVTYIGDYAFYNCVNLTGSLTIPNGVTSIGDNAFNGCENLDGTLTIPSGVTYIGDNAFCSCYKLNGTLTIPSDVTSIGDGAFAGCSGFSGTLTIPSGVTSIGQGAFASCSGFSGDLTIPSGVTSIEGYTFNNCTGLDGTLTIPSEVSSIGAYAFSSCDNLSAIVVQWTSNIPTVYLYQFPDSFKTTGGKSITIPAGKTSTYNKVDGWSMYNLVEQTN